MTGVVDLFFAPVQLFVWRPDRIAIVGISFLVLVGWLYFVRRQVVWPAILTAQIWFAFAVWESWAKSVKANIRVDLFAIWPLLLASTICGVVWSFRRKQSLSLRAMLTFVTIFCIVIALGMMSLRAKIAESREKLRDRPQQQRNAVPSLTPPSPPEGPRG